MLLPRLLNCLRRRPAPARKSARPPRRTPVSARPWLEALEDRLTPTMPATVINVDATVTGPNGLIAAIQAADATSGGAVLQLTPGAVYTLTAPLNGGGTATPEQNNWYGPDGLPAIDNNVWVEGNGATIQRSGAAGTPAFRLLYVSGGEELAAGTLTLHNLTLANGLAHGGNSNGGGGGGLGAGGAIFNMGTLSVNGVTLTGNSAVGGNSAGRGVDFSSGGGGIGLNVTAGAVAVSGLTVSGFAAGLLAGPAPRYLSLTDVAFRGNAFGSALNGVGTVLFAGGGGSGASSSGSGGAAAVHLYEQSGGAAFQESQTADGTVELDVSYAGGVVSRVRLQSLLPAPGSSYSDGGTTREL